MESTKALNAVLPLTPTVYHMLVALAGGPRHGYSIAQEVEELTDGRIVMGPGTLYGSLQRMQAQALIVETANPGEEGTHVERRRYYEVTDLGRHALRAESARLLRAVTVAQARLGT